MLAARLVGRPRVVLLWSVVLYSTVWRGTVLQYVLVVMLVVWRIRIKEKAENRLAVVRVAVRRETRAPANARAAARDTT